MKTALQGLFPEELRALCEAAGQPGFRAKQLWQWVQVQGATRWEQMGNLPKALKEKLAETHTPEPAKILKESGLKITSADHLADAAEKIVKAVKEAN